MNLTLKRAVLSVRKLATTGVIFSGLILSAPASAANQCAGLENAACAAAESCAWVQGYERKDGRQVKAFCRSKAKKATKQTEQGKQGS